MLQSKDKRILTIPLIERYSFYLQEQEKSKATVQKYTHDLKRLCRELRGRELTKLLLLSWKQELINRYAPASVNTMLAGLNGLLEFCGWTDLKVKPVKIQKNLFCQEEKELTKEEYFRLIRAAQRQKNQRLALVLQTICATGIRVSELPYITAEAVKKGRAVVRCKGKVRNVFLPSQLCQLLRGYLRQQKRSTGPLFVTSTGKPMNRSNIWREMKRLCQTAGVSPNKVFPHNLRHLFARTYYALEKDLSRLADILGHTDVSTTRIYTVESGRVHQRQMDQMRLVTT